MTADRSASLKVVRLAVGLLRGEQPLGDALADGAHALRGFRVPARRLRLSASQARRAAGAAVSAARRRLAPRRLPRPRGSRRSRRWLRRRFVGRRLLRRRFLGAAWPRPVGDDLADHRPDRHRLALGHLDAQHPRGRRRHFAWRPSPFPARRSARRRGPYRRLSSASAMTPSVIDSPTVGTLIEIAMRGL